MIMCSLLRMESLSFDALNVVWLAVVLAEGLYAAGAAVPSVGRLSVQRIVTGCMLMSLRLRHVY